MVLDDMKDYIVATSALWTASNTFKSAMPEDPDQVLTLYEYQGGDAAYMLGGDSHSSEVVQMQAVVRDSSYAVARAAANDLMSLLSELTDPIINSVRYLRVLANDLPHEVGSDSKQRTKIATNYSVYKEPS